MSNDDSFLQVMANARYHEGGEEAFTSIHERIRRGDIVGVVGHPSRTKKVTLSTVIIKLKDEL